MKNIESMLLEIDIEGDEYHLVLMDGSKWFVNPGDLPTVATWIPTANIKVENTKDDSMFSSKLTNTNIDISVLSMKIN
jgi:hypothetical protein